MAGAPGHRLGQIIGNILELSLEPILAGYAKEYGLYLDKHGPREARPGVKLTWEDGLGNKHDLDYVIERGGTDSKIGLPVAFVEVAWRRYTKHSRNKAQEIQGAILPLIAKYSNIKPFAGVVLAGLFTKGSLEQLKSNNFSVIYIPYDVVVKVFATYGIDVEFDESTPDEHLLEQINKYDVLTDYQKLKLAEDFRASEPKQFQDFQNAIYRVLGRQIRSVRLLPLYGDPLEFTDTPSATSYLDEFQESSSSTLHSIEVSILYNNDDEIKATFGDSSDAKEFLQAITS